MTGFVEPRRVDHLDAFRDSADEVSSRPSGPTRKIRRRRDTKSYTWILRTAHGAALVDAGSDPKGEAALEALKAQGLTQADVHTILLTHGHKDHWAAAALFPNAKIRVGADDVAMVKGDRKYQPALIDKLTNAPAEQPRALEALGEDETLSLDGLEVRAVYVRDRPGPPARADGFGQGCSSGGP